MASSRVPSLGLLGVRRGIDPVTVAIGTSQTSTFCSSIEVGEQAERPGEARHLDREAAVVGARVSELAHGMHPSNRIAVPDRLASSRPRPAAPARRPLRGHPARDPACASSPPAARGTLEPLDRVMRAGTCSPRIRARPSRRRLDPCDDRRARTVPCKREIGQISGRPGSPRRIFFGSVTNERTCARIVSGSSLSSIVLSRDFDILRPSDPGISGVSDSSGCGSTSTSPYSRLKRPDDLARDLEMRDLVLPDRNDLSVDDRDVDRLQERIPEQAEVRHVALGHVAQTLLVRRHPLQPSERRDHAEQQRELRHLRQVGTAGTRRTARDRSRRRADPSTRPSTNGGKLVDPVVVRRQHVPVGHEVEAFVPLVLQADGVADVARPVSDVQRSGRAEPGQRRAFVRRLRSRWRR